MENLSIKISLWQKDALCRQHSSNLFFPPATFEKKDDRVRTIERMHLVSDISKIKKTIGWRPKINLEEALLNTAKYYK